MVLNTKQLELIEKVNSSRYILVKAPAGTGKTFCSIQCAKKFIDESSNFNKEYQKVLLLTFSKNARSQLIKESKNQKKIENYLEITNYHSFMKKYIDIYRSIIGIKNNISIIPEEDLKKKIGGESEGYDLNKVINGCTPESDVKDSSFKAKYAKIKILITEYTQNTGEICFEQFGYLSNKILDKCHSLNKYISQHYPLIIIDEYQDTDYYQSEFIDKILKNCRGIFFADDLQMIYEFRGAKKERLDELYKKYPDISTVIFDEIYRYKDKKDIMEILENIRNNKAYNYNDLTNGIWFNLDVDADRNWRQKKNKNAQCSIILATIFWKIINTIKEQMVSGKSIAILCRTGYEAEKLRKIFIDNHFKINGTRDSNDLLRIATNIKYIMKENCIDGNEQKYTFLALMSTNHNEIDGKVFEKINVMKARTGILRKIKDVFIELKKSEHSKLEYIEKIIDILKNNGYQINFSILYFIRACFGINEVNDEKIDKLLIARQYINSYSNITSGIYIMTMHQSKGKEFDVVYIIDADRVKDETNLNYVVHSRMKECLFPITYSYKGTKWGNK